MSAGVGGGGLLTAAGSSGVAHKSQALRAESPNQSAQVLLQPTPAADTHAEKMHKCVGILCASLIFCAALSESIGLVIAAKEKRGWTLNSAGYLLGPHGIDGHRTLGDKQGLAGKRDMGQEEDFRPGALRIADEDIIHTVVDFLSYLKLKEMGALENLPPSVTSDEMTNP
ncbi:Galanin peptide [Oryzias melastigma]|uniref:Galanin peptides n=2 Tax=Oryzias melastigma TaxID=30732 RepID=A0A834BS56_ORYME|nr:galanin peptides isoform X2 [Oryzias melastigma]KAF6716329.1 Galanin peptide [Oryzias melastigma]